MGWHDSVRPLHSELFSRVMRRLTLFGIRRGLEGAFVVG